MITKLYIGLTLMSEVERSRFLGYLMKQGRLVECRKFILQRISFLSPMEMKFCAIASRKTLIYSIRVWWWRYETIFDYKYYICSVYSFLLRIKFLFQLNYNKPFTRNKRNGKNLKLFAFNCYMQKCRKRISYMWSKIKKRFLNSTLQLRGLVGVLPIPSTQNDLYSFLELFFWTRFSITTITFYFVRCN